MRCRSASTAADELPRREFLAALTASLLGVWQHARGSSQAESQPMTQAATSPKSQRMPLLFLGHGSPMNAIEGNQWSRGWRALGDSIPKPRAILCVSAHWFVPGTFVTGNLQPETIHDFGGFPRPLYEVRYPARGDTELAKLITTLLSSSRAEQRSDWGLDHGAWSVLMHLRPKADIPVLQLSIDYRQPPATHLAIGKMLSVLREQGILIIGSGNITHNLRLALRPGGTDSPTWATSFDADVARALQQHDDTFLLRALTTDAGKIAHPTPDHYLPLLYVAGACSPADSATFPLVGFDFGCLSMRSVLFS